MTGRLISVPSRATREEGRATGLYPSGVYPCSVPLGFRGSPTPRPQLVATPQPSSAMHGTFFVHSWIAFRLSIPSFAANLAPPPARRGSIPAALGGPPPLSVSLPRVRPPSLLIAVLGRLQCLPLFSSPHLMGQEDPLAAHSRSVSPPPPPTLTPFVAFWRPLWCVSLSAYPSVSFPGFGVRGSAGSLPRLVPSLRCLCAAGLG